MSPHGDYMEITVPLPGSANSVASGVEPRTPGGGHAKKRSGGRGVLAPGGDKNGGAKYGPLGPLEDDDDWGRGMNGYSNGHKGGYGSGGGGNGKGKRI